MINILLQKDYQTHRKGDTIAVSNNVAFGLESSGIGQRVTTKSFEAKTEFGATKAFRQPPSKSIKKEEIVEDDLTTEADSKDEAEEEQL